MAGLEGIFLRAQSRCHYPSSVFMSQSCAFGMWGFCCYLPFMAPASQGTCCDGQQRTVAMMGYHGASPLPSGCLTEVVFWEGSPAPVLNSSSAVSYWGSRTRLLVSTVSGTHSSDLWRCWLESWVPDFSLTSTFFVIKLFILRSSFTCRYNK